MTVPVVLSQHAEDAAFHWLLRDAAVRAPHYSLADLAKLDGRLEAHLDGLTIAGDAGWEIVKNELAWEEAGEVFTGLCLAAQGGDPLRTEEVLAVADQSLELARGAISALGWLSHDVALPMLQQLAASENPVRRRIAVGGLAAHRPATGKTLAELVKDSDPIVRARALKAIGEMRRADLLHECVADLQSEDPDCRFWSAWSGALLGHAGAIRVLQSLAEPGAQRAEAAAALAARRLERGAAVRWVQQLATEPALLRAAVKAAGAVGDPVLVPWLLELMHTPELARVAGEAVSMITGVDLAFEDLDGDAVEGADAGPTEDPEDDNVALDDDEDLPWPHPQRLAAWWAQHSAQFPAGTRYLCGQPVSAAAAAGVLRDGMQRQRHAAATELAALDAARPLFNVAAPGARQQRMLGL